MAAELKLVRRQLLYLQSLAGPEGMDGEQMHGVTSKLYLLCIIDTYTQPTCYKH